VGCRRVASQEELVRVVAVAGGGLATGRTLPGRGAWLCAGSPACVEAAERRKAFERALRTPVQGQAVDDLKIMLAPRGRLDS
jgi:predicted RNA-binding protein YlxR (DUF448 family)